MQKVILQKTFTIIVMILALFFFSNSNIYMDSFESKLEKSVPSKTLNNDIEDTSNLLLNNYSIFLYNVLLLREKPLATISFHDYKCITTIFKPPIFFS